VVRVLRGDQDETTATIGMRIRHRNNSIITAEPLSRKSALKFDCRERQSGIGLDCLALRQTRFGK
jgi:hypothetical protein